MHTILDFGIRLIVALQGLGPWLTLPMKLLSSLGTEDFYMLALPVIYWCVDSVGGIRLALLLMLSTNVNAALKLAFHGPRPYWYSPDVRALASETSFGVPSGHAQNAAIVWGLLASILRKWWGWLVAVLLTLFIGISRLYLGVHFPQDVLLGWLIGGLILWLTLRFWDLLAARIKKHTTKWQILAALLASLVLFLLPLVPYIWLKVTNWQPLQTWAFYDPTTAIQLSDAATAAGTFFGLAAGLIWLKRQGGFQTRGVMWKLILRYLIGIAGVLIIRYGLKAIFPEGEYALAYFLRYLRYGLIGFWIGGGAPWTFIRVKLAGSE